MARQGQAPTAFETWLNGRPSWLRATARQLLDTARAPTDKEIDDLANHCLEEAANQLVTVSSDIAVGAIVATPSGGDVRLEQITDIRGVNALGARASLDLSLAPLTVVYGGNGTGKSGYARLVKQLCGARAAEPIHGNVFAEKRDPISARVVMSTIVLADGLSNRTRYEIDWQAQAGAVRRLNAVHVFDTATAVKLGHSPNTASHLPRTMRFIGALIDASDRIAANLRQRAGEQLSALQSVSEKHVGSEAAKFYCALKATLTAREINEACHFSEAQRIERVGLEAALAQADPATAHSKVVADLKHVEKLGRELATWAAPLDQEHARIVVGARMQAKAAREAAQAYASGVFEGAPLAGVGEGSWRRMWAAAAQYSEEFAYPGHVHPNTEDNACCVLCQQPLGPEGRTRMVSFKEYVDGRLEADAKEADRALAEHVANLPRPLGPDYWQAVAASVRFGEDDTKRLEEQVIQRLHALLEQLDLDAVPNVDWTTFFAAQVQRAADLEVERTNLAALLDPDGRRQKEATLAKLQASEWLASQRDNIVAEVRRLQRLSEIETAVRSTNTAVLTTKSNEIGETELAQGYCARFNEELERLGGMSIRVLLICRKEGKGKLTFSIELRDAHERVASREVLSEGEQRVVALAAFFADVTGSDRSLPVIFDDPISSLDQHFEEAAAKRLVELATSRQVIVFTHRLSLMALLSDQVEQRTAQRQTDISLHVAAIDRDGVDTGVPSTIDVFSIKPKAGFDELSKRVRAAEDWDLPMRNLAMKDACSNFRILVERTIEDHLCSKVIVRFRRSITTINRLPKLAAIDAKDCQLIDQMMTKYSSFEHSQAYEAPIQLPESNQLIADIHIMLEWIRDFEKRAAVV